MSADEDSVKLIARWKEGDQAAAEAIFDRYVSRLTALVRKRIGARLQRRVDPEDVLQSAYRSFFRKSQQDEFEKLDDGDDMWRLLAAITINKLLSQCAFHGAAKRSIAEEASVNGFATVLRVSPDAIAREPAPDEAVAMIDELQNVMETLEELPRKVLELRLTGLDPKEIAAEVFRSPRSVRRILAELHTEFHQRLHGSLID